MITYHKVPWVRCGTWLYRFLIFAPLLTLRASVDILDTPHLDNVDPPHLNIRQFDVYPLFNQFLVSLSIEL